MSFSDRGLRAVAGVGASFGATHAGRRWCFEPGPAGNHFRGGRGRGWSCWERQRDWPRVRVRNPRDVTSGKGWTPTPPPPLGSGIVFHRRTASNPGEVRSTGRPTGALRSKSLTSGLGALGAQRSNLNSSSDLGEEFMRLEPQLSPQAHSDGLNNGHKGTWVGLRDFSRVNELPGLAGVGPKPLGVPARYGVSKHQLRSSVLDVPDNFSFLTLTSPARTPERSSHPTAAVHLAVATASRLRGGPSRFSMLRTSSRNGSLSPDSRAEGPVGAWSNEGEWCFPWDESGGGC